MIYQKQEYRLSKFGKLLQMGALHYKIAPKSEGVLNYVHHKEDLVGITFWKPAVFCQKRVQN